MARIHILGASGSGTSTLGAVLAERLGHEFVDADALFWLPTDPPFTTRQPADDRRTLLLQFLPTAGQWVVSGSALGWAAPIEPFYDLVVFLRIDPVVRMERLRRRQAGRYGARAESGGDMAEVADGACAAARFLGFAARPRGCRSQQARHRRPGLRCPPINARSANWTLAIDRIGRRRRSRRLPGAQHQRLA